MAMVTKVIIEDKAFDILIWFSQHDYAFIAEVEQLPACRGEGLTEEQAMERIQVIIRNCVRAGNQPEPRR